MSAKLKKFLILLLGIFGIITAVVYLTKRHSMSQESVTDNTEQQSLFANQTQQVVVVPDRVNYKTIPLEKINSVLQGSDPSDLALNAFDDLQVPNAKRTVQVLYPKPNQALVTITQTAVKNNLIKAMKYRVELTTVGRSLLVSSPPVWQIVWAGTQIQCVSKASRYQKSTVACN